MVVFAVVRVTVIGVICFTFREYSLVIYFTVKIIYPVI